MNLLTDGQFSTLYARIERLVTRSGCNHTLRRTRTWIQAHAEPQAVRGNLAKVMDLGGFCDCEVLMNVTPDVWQARRQEPLLFPDLLKQGEGEELVSRKMMEAVQYELWT